MLKKSLIISLAVLLAFVGFSSCKSSFGAPVGSKSDYTEIPVKSADYELRKGVGYYLERPLPTSMYYMGERSTSYTFTATEDVKVYYAEKLSYDTTSNVDVRRVGIINSYGLEDVELEHLKESSSKSFDTEVDLKAGDSFRISITIYKYNTDESTAAKFYIWAE